MPITKSAKKALRQQRHKTIVNKPIRSKIKTASDAFKKTPSSEGLSSAFSALDKAAKRNIIHKNKASRIKAALSKLLKK